MIQIFVMAYIHNGNNEKTSAKKKFLQNQSTLNDDEIDLNRQSTNVTLLHKKDTLLHGIKLILVIFGLCCSVFLVSLDNSVVSTALPRIVSDFNGLNQFALVVISYIITEISFQPMYGKLSDIFGPKISLIIYRAVAGIGGGGILSLVIIIISEIVSIKDQGKFQGLVALCYTISSIAGPLVGGALTDYVSWRWCFLINLPTGAIAMIIIIFLLHLPKPTGSLFDKFKRIDIIGTIIMMPSTVCILLSLNWGGSVYAWNSPVIIVLLCVGILGYIIFGLVENYIVIEPIVPPNLFKNLNVVSCFILNFFMGAAFFSYIFYIPFYFQVVKADSATQSGLDFFPYLLTVSIFVTLSGQLFSRTDKISFRSVFIFASLMAIIGSGLITMWNENTEYIELIVCMIINGVGIGLPLQSVILCVQCLTEHKDIASATTLSFCFRNIGTVFGISISGTAFNNKLIQLLNTLNLPSYFSTQSVYTIQSLPSDTRTLVIDAYILAFRIIFELIMLFTVLLFITSMFVGNVKPKHK
ncbi:MFS general substrate transporter [Gigaspora margarita]|uniref:MFS general substrate transporter n=1 Tax=Gigaspora margarita TaxID=4874 RepID=A0A8H4AMI2_GIGMA|nr:MFS general substrate transporter [Gigaspora margarita]